MDSNKVKSSVPRGLWILPLALVVYALLISRGFGPYLSDEHAFRQAQTALTARHLNSWADLFAYTTPVLGAPWSIPFEFPLYQALTRLLQATSGWPLETSGRLVSATFYLLCLVPLVRILALLEVKSPSMILAPLLVTPLYVYWSRAVLIETTALFFCLAYAASYGSMLRRMRPTAIDVVILVSFGLLGGLTKVTTLLPLMLAGLLAQGWMLLPRTRWRMPWRSHALIAVANAVVVVALAAWVTHTDAIKLANPIGAFLTSEHLRAWNFGWLGQRFDVNVMTRLAHRTVEIFVPRVVGLQAVRDLAVLCMAAFAVTCYWLSSPLRRRQALLLGALYFLPIAIFLNLHLVHNYYQVSNGLFLVLAGGLLVYGALEGTSLPAARRGLWAGYFGTLLVMSIASRYYLDSSSTDQHRWGNLIKLVGQHSTSNDAIAITGLDWSPEVPYLADRHALMLPRFATAVAVQRAVHATNASTHRIVLFVNCGRRAPHYEAAREHLRVTPEMLIGEADGCQIYSVPATNRW